MLWISGELRSSCRAADTLGELLAECCAARDPLGDSSAASPAPGLAASVSCNTTEFEGSARRSSASLSVCGCSVAACSARLSSHEAISLICVLAVPNMGLTASTDTLYRLSV